MDAEITACAKPTGSQDADGAGTPGNVSRVSSIHDFERLTGAAIAEEGVTFKSQACKWWRKQTAKHEHRMHTYHAWDWVALCFPFVTWLKEYKVREYLLLDCVAGVSIGFMAVPQSISYALLAGLPAVYGLYTAFVPVLVYALFGSSHHLAVGSVAVTSLMLGNALRSVVPEADGIADPNEPGALASVQADYNAAAIQITFLVGTMYLIVAVLRLSFLANFLSHSILSGFTTGSAVLIGLSQAPYMFGIKVAHKATALGTFIEVVRHIDETQWPELVMALCWLALLLAVKHVAKAYARLAWMRSLGPMTVCVLSIIVVLVGRLDQEGGVRTVKHVPSGLPSITINLWSPIFDASKQIAAATTIFLVSFMESISIAKAIARKHKYDVDVSQEIVAMGLANFAGSMFNAGPATGSFTRSAVGADLGAKTALKGVITGFFVMLVLLFVTPVFEFIPYNAVGAVVISSVFGLLEFKEARFLLKVDFLDFLVWAAAFCGTVFLGIKVGLGIAIGFAVLLVVYQSAYPHTAVLGALPDSKIYRNIKQYPTAVQHAHILVLRIDAPIYFANVESIRARVAKYHQRAEASPHLGRVLHVVIDMSPVPFVDSTGVHALRCICASLKDRGVSLVLANPSCKVQAQLRRVQVLQEIGHCNVYVRTADAVDVCRAAVNEALKGETSVEIHDDSAEP